jgi:hypothetical protein
MDSEKDYSGQIAWGIIKAAFVIYIGYYILVPLLAFFGITSAVVVYFIANNYKQIIESLMPIVAIGFYVFIVGVILYSFYKAFVHKHLMSLLELMVSAFLSLIKTEPKKEQPIEVNISPVNTPVEENNSNNNPNLLPTESPSKAHESEFVPDNQISSLYCYQCTKKIGLKAWQKNGYFYCKTCIDKLNSSDL